jgi:two-component system response regulator HydG
MKSNSILIIDDELSFLRSLRRLLWDQGYNDIVIEQSPIKALEVIKAKCFDLIILDVSMPEMDGIVLLEKLIQKNPSIPIIMVTAIDDIKTALTATKIGAYEYIVKPPDTDRLFITIKRALEQRLLQLERDTLRTSKSITTSIRPNFKDVITQSTLMYKVFDLVEIFAPTDETILIIGETGTGKDLIAKKIHELSSRKDQQFISVNLASISSTLFESELFGHVKGSFTGAIQDKVGFFEAANKGTIFLDEIGELPRELQGKLLRIIQYSEIYKIGSTKPIKLDIRIIAATNRDLNKAVENNEFRPDLYYRLNRGYIQLPPLRDRIQDLRPLVEHFIDLGKKNFKKEINGIDENLLFKLENYSFPGNIRELENLMMNAVAKTKEGEAISEIQLPFQQKKTEKNISDIELISIEAAIEKHILFVLSQTSGNMHKAASILNVSERTLQRRLQQIRNNQNNN